MEARPRIRHALIVEGRYDKIKLESLVDALILPTDGFRIFKDREMRALIRRLAADCGVAVLTDSDAAGFLIRRHLRGIVGEDAQIVDVYIPDLAGKEPRKRRRSKEGKLGVEGVPAEVILDALRRAGLLEEAAPAGEHITPADLYEAGLSGRENSRALRAALLRELGLPARLSGNALPGVLGRLLGREELFALADRLREEPPPPNKAEPPA